MLINKVIRSYSRSINSKNYGVPESWVKVESTYEATVESDDNPMEVSKMLGEQAKKEVVETCNEIIDAMKNGAKNIQAGIASAVAASSPLNATPAGTSNVAGGGQPRSL